ncbi:MAG: prepilin-type N-terminal cleavage/methylation domain-containing protein [Desulfobacterales bacterium]
MGAKHTDRPCSAAAGFTLIEVMIAMVIFTVGLLAIFSMHISSIRGNAAARGVTENATVAAGKIEQLMAMPYEDAELDPTSVHQETAASGYHTITWQVQEDCLGADFSGHKCVQVQVSSTVNGHQTKEVRIDFIKANML